MNRPRFFLGGLLFAATLCVASAQTNTDTSDQMEKVPKPTTEIPHPSGGPVVMPPADQVPPPPAPETPNVPAPQAAPTPESSPTPAAPSPSAPQINPPPPMANAAPQEEEIYDIRPPFFYLRSWLWLWIALAVVGGIALLVLLWNWFRTHAERKAKTAYDLALEKLEKARALMREDDPAPYAVAVSEILRTYIGQRFQAPSTRRTTEEFLRQMQTDAATPIAGHRELLGHFLQACDLVKFARYQPTLDELEQVQQSAVTFVTATRPVPATAHQNGARP